MHIHCTQKLLKELKQPVVEMPAFPSESWHANLLIIDRRKCVLVTHNKTLYSVFMPAYRQPQFKQFPHLFQQTLFKSLRVDGFIQPQIEYWLDQMRDIQFSKTNNRSVLGSMNEFTASIQLHTSANGGLMKTDMNALHQYLNSIIMRPIHYQNGLSAMRQYLQEQNPS
jgi:hypothetical protein